jgi:hypothetical protein
LLVALQRQERQLLPWPNLRPTQKRPLLLLVATQRQKGETQRQKGKIVVVTNITTTAATEYKSISEAATVLNLTRVTLRKYIKNKEIFNMLKESDSGLVKEKYLITLKGPLLLAIETQRQKKT